MDNQDAQNQDSLLLLRAVGNMAKTTTNFILFGAVVGIIIGIIRGSLIDVLIFGPSVASMFGAIGLIYGIVVQGRLLREERKKNNNTQQNSEAGNVVM